MTEWTEENLNVYAESFGLEEIAGYKVVVSHPRADQPEVLEELELQPEDCTSLDLYAVLNGRVYFISIASEGIAHQRAGFLSYRTRTEGPRGSFFMVTAEPVITTDVVEKALSTTMQRLRKV